MFDDISPRRVASFTDQVQRHSSAERLRWHDEAGDARIALSRVDAGLHWNDDAMLRRSLGTARAEVRDKAERNGWDDVQIQAALLHETSRTLVTAIHGAVERDPLRAQALAFRYDKHIDDRDRLGLDRLLDEGRARHAAGQASEAIREGRSPAPEEPTDAPKPPLNPRTNRPTLEWQLEQAEAIPEPSTRARTAARLRSADAADEAAAESRERMLAEDVLSRVMKDQLSDPSKIPAGQWVTLDETRRRAIEKRLDHNLRGDEPPPNPSLVDELATQMAQEPQAFARRDLLPLIAQLPLAQWQRFRNWQAGIRRNDPTTEDQLYAIKRGLQLATKMLPAVAPSAPDDDATNTRAALIEEIDTARKLTGASPDDAVLREMVQRTLPDPSFHNIGLRQQALRGALSGPALDALSGLFLMMLMDSFFLQSRVYEMTRPASPSPLPPLEPAEPLPPLPPSTPPSEDWSKNPPSRPVDPAPTIHKGPELGAPRPPTTLKGPDIDAPRPPTIYKSEEPKQKHHNIPQFLWNPHRGPDKKPKFEFHPDAIKVFAGAITEIPEDEHWGFLHDKYNAAAERAMRAYLNHAKENHETEEQFAGRMSEEQAKDCYKYIIAYIRKPPETKDPKEIDENKYAKEFLDNVFLYVEEQK